MTAAAHPVEDHAAADFHFARKLPLSRVYGERAVAHASIVVNITRPDTLRTRSWRQPTKVTTRTSISEGQLGVVVVH